MFSLLFAVLFLAIELFYFRNIISLGFYSAERQSLLKLNYFVADPLLSYKQKIKGSSLTDFRNIDKLISLEEEGFDKKYILKESFSKYFPKSFLDKKKKGFGVPVGDWLRGSLRSELLSYINAGFLKKQNIFDPEWISKLVMDHVNGKIDNTFKVWTYYCFQKWYKANYD